jgi:hypothetical protein
MAFWVWKLASGHTVDMSQFAVAAMARVERWPAASIVAAAVVKVRRVIMHPLRFVEIETQSRRRTHQPSKP